jgi:hypothetical protein
VLVSDLHLAARAYALLAVRAALAGTQGIMPKS